MTGYVNAIQERAYKFSTQGPQEIPVPAELKAQMDDMQASLMETAAENDEILLDKYFAEGKLTKDETVHGVRRGIATGSVIPVMAGSALQNRGVINLLDEIVRYMPTANERKNSLATDLLADEIVNVNCEEDGPFAAQVFKTVYDAYFCTEGQKNRARSRAYGGRYRRGEQADEHRHQPHPLRRRHFACIRPHTLPPPLPFACDQDRE